MIPPNDTRILVAAEMDGAVSWAKRYGLTIQWMPDVLELRVPLEQPESREQFFLMGKFDDYRALAPSWVFTDENWQHGANPRYYPKPASTPYGASIFIQHNGAPIICVPFNRLAYAENKGPHGDWGAPTNWLSAGNNYVTAFTLGDMVSVIFRDFILTRGRMGN